jgi:hypothetical protein
MTTRETTCRQCHKRLVTVNVRPEDDVCFLCVPLVRTPSASWRDDG